ncbi:hypothetical protein [Oryzihumus sp.]
MTLWRWTWRATVVLLTAVALPATLLSQVRWYDAAIVIGAGTLIGGLAGFSLPDDLPGVRHPVGLGAVAGGIGLSWLMGLSVLIGPWTLLVALGMAGSSPLLLTNVLQRQHRAGARRYLDSPTTRTETLPDVLARMTDDELRLAWRSSTVALRGATGPHARLRVVCAREQYLDEFERRAPEAFSSWLPTAARSDEPPVLGGPPLG